MWHIEKWDTNLATPVWTSYENLGELIEEPTLEESSIVNKIQLIDGSFARITRPNLTKNPVVLNISPFSITEAFIVKIQDYYKNHTGIRITTHTEFVTPTGIKMFQGYIVSADLRFLQTGKSQYYSYQLTIDRFPVDGGNDW